MSEIKRYLAVVFVDGEDRMSFLYAKNIREIKNKLKDKYGENVVILNILEL